jgi:hypothetical protein
MRRALYATLLPMLFVASCTTTHIMNIENTPLPTRTDGSRHTAAEVETAILSACNQRGWSANVQSPGVITASILVRTHMAAVEIRYTDATLSIQYRDSDNLEHHDDMIHRNYNRWVVNLYGTIMRNLGSRVQAY